MDLNDHKEVDSLWEAAQAQFKAYCRAPTQPLPAPDSADGKHASLEWLGVLLEPMFNNSHEHTFRETSAPSVPKAPAKEHIRPEVVTTNWKDLLYEINDSFYPGDHAMAQLARARKLSRQSAQTTVPPVDPAVEPTVEFSVNPAVESAVHQPAVKQSLADQRAIKKEAFKQQMLEQLADQKASMQRAAKQQAFKEQMLEQLKDKSLAEAQKRGEPNPAGVFFVPKAGVVQKTVSREKRLTSKLAINRAQSDQALEFHGAYVDPGVYGPHTGIDAYAAAYPGAYESFDGSMMYVSPFPDNETTFFGNSLDLNPNQTYYAYHHQYTNEVYQNFSYGYGRHC